MSKRPLSKESLESPFSTKTTRRDDAMLNGISEVRQRFADAEKQRWAYLRVPLPTLSEAEMEAAMKRLEEAAVVHFATYQGAKTYNLFMLTCDGTSNAGIKTLFGPDSSMQTWFATMQPFLFAENVSASEKAKDWIFEQMDAFFNAMADKWNKEHVRFHMKWDQVIIAIRDCGNSVNE